MVMVQGNIRPSLVLRAVLNCISVQKLGLRPPQRPKQAQKPKEAQKLVTKQGQTKIIRLQNQDQPKLVPRTTMEVQGLN